MSTAAPTSKAPAATVRRLAAPLAAVARFSHPLFRTRGRAVLTAAGCALALTGVLSPNNGAAATPASAAYSSQPIYLNTSYPFAERAADLVSRMTLAEKVAQLSTGNGGSSADPGIPRLGVQDYTYRNEAAHGISYLGNDQNAGGTTAKLSATSFPVGLSASLTWDPALVYRESSAISDEARGFVDPALFGVSQNDLGSSKSNYGSLSFWAPTINMDRDPRWGRAEEVYGGEDPYLAGQMGGAYVNGLQGNDQSGNSATGYLKAAATVKHFALNNIEINRRSSDSVVSDAALHDYYTQQFKDIIEGAHAAGMMSSYNAINGTPAVTDTYTLDQIAQRTYGFDGYATSDCNGVTTAYNGPPGTQGGGHDWAPPGWSTDDGLGNAVWTNTATGARISGAAGAEAWALRAGGQLNCQSGENTLANIQAAIDAGVLSQGVIDDALTRIFTVRMETGEFDPASSVSYTQIKSSVINSAANQALAQQVADNSLVLLKNSNVSGTTARLLPADPAKLNNVVILGDMANSVTLGGYSSAPTATTNAVQGITAAVKAANPNATVTFDPAGTSSTSTTAAVLSTATQTAIKNADLVVVFVGTNTNNANEYLDRSDLNMPGDYDSLISQTAALGNGRMALVVQSDGPVKVSDVQGDFPAVLFSSYNGQAQGAALADVLFGKQNPSGHLSFTWYQDASQLPAMTDYGLAPDTTTSNPGRTYEYFTDTPTYPFGYGLSYSSFSYSAATVDKSSVTADDTVNVTFSVKNTGTVAGATVAQLYAASPAVTGVTLPKERLVGFKKTNVLAAGASQTITLPVKISDLSRWDGASAKETVDDGTYTLRVGASSADIKSSVSVAVAGSITPKVRYVTVQPESVVYNAGQTIDLTGKNQWIKDDTTGVGADPQTGRNMNVTADNVVEAVDNDESFADLSKATVTYASSDTSVAKVSSAGLVTAVGDGAATITVTVNGVSGTAPIIVQHTLAVSAPGIITAGSSAKTVTTTFTNPGSTAKTNVAVTLAVPTGWTATATTPSTFASVAAGATATTTWTVTAPTSAIGSNTLTAQATLDSVGPYTDTATVTTPYKSLTAAFDNIGITDDSATSTGDLDGNGLSYSAQTLATAGLTPGSALTHDGITLTWPNVASGSKDNVVAEGQTIPVSGTGSTLAFLGSSVNSTASGTGTVTYTDGSTSSYSLAFANWWSATAAAGSDIAATLPYINNSSGKKTQSVQMFYAAVPLTPGKTAQYVTLPDVSSSAAKGVTALHVFAMGVGSPITSGGVYTINRVGTSQVVEDPSFATTAGKQLDVWPLNSDTNQKWTATATGDGSFTLKNSASGLCMGVSGSSTTAGATIVQWTCNGHTDQNWIPTPSGADFTLVDVNSGLSATVGGTADGSTLAQQSTGTAWTFTKVG